MEDYRIWQTLLQSAIVGADRSALPPPLLAVLQERGIDVFAAPEEVLLSAAALTRQRIRAGQQLPRLDEPLPTPAADTTEPLSTMAGRFLSIMLNGRFAPALREWVALFVRSGQSLPPESLPGLLKQCVEDPAIRQTLEPYLGDRARWLIEQNPDWTALKEPLPDPLQQRIGFLAKQEKLDSNKISGLPEGETLEKLLEFADSCITGKDLKIGLSLQNPIPDWAFQKGWLRKRKDASPGSVLQTLLSWVPPSHWEKRWDAAPDFIYEHMLRAKEVSPLIYSLVNATILYQEKEWAWTILDCHANRIEPLEFQPGQIERLSDLLTTELFQDLIGMAWDDEGGHLDGFGAAEELLLHSNHPWAEDFSREWLGELQKLLIHSGDSWRLWDYRNILRQAAYKVPPYPNAPWMGGWEQMPPQANFIWKDDISYFLKVLRFRIDMHEAFS